MGTVLEITLVGPDAATNRARMEPLFAEAARLEALLSSWDPQSDLSRLNGAAGAGPRRVDPEVAALVERALRYTALTRGTFDVTIGPLVRLWRDAEARDVPPTPAQLTHARHRVGPDQLRVHGDGRVELVNPGASVDLGGIAKGYALDRMLPLLRERGVEGALLNFGQSSTWAIGTPPGGAGWRLLVRGPGESFLGVITLRDRALSISGSLGQWVEIGGRRYGHVFDPRTGEPLGRRRQSLVVAPDATTAEALSKALLILGETAGIALVDAQEGCEGLLVDAEGGFWETPGRRSASSRRPQARLRGLRSPIHDPRLRVPHLLRRSPARGRRAQGRRGDLHLLRSPVPPDRQPEEPGVRGGRGLLVRLPRSAAPRGMGRHRPIDSGRNSPSSCDFH